MVLASSCVTPKPACCHSCPFPQALLRSLALSAASILMMRLLASLAVAMPGCRPIALGASGTHRSSRAARNLPNFLVMPLPSGSTSLEIQSLAKSCHSHSSGCHDTQDCSTGGLNGNDTGSPSIISRCLHICRRTACFAISPSISGDAPAAAAASTAIATSPSMPSQKQSKQASKSS